MSEEKEMESPKLDELVKTYITIRTARENLSREYYLKDGELENDMKQLEIVMLDACNEINADSVRTSFGTITKTIKEQYSCNNWDEFKEYIKQENALELLQQRIHQTNFREFMANHEGEGLPPGISSMREFSVVVRKSSK